jgi:hypothetical protein
MKAMVPELRGGFDGVTHHLRAGWAFVLIAINHGAAMKGSVTIGLRQAERAEFECGTGGRRGKAQH